MIAPRMRAIAPSPVDRIRRTEALLMSFATAFLLVNAIALHLAPAVQANSPTHLQLSLRIVLPCLVWLVAGWIGHACLNRWLPIRDPFLFPSAMFLTGWGLMIITRISAVFAMRQTVWLVLAVATILVIVRYPVCLTVLRRYRYLVICAALAALAATFAVGVSAQPNSEKLWLGLGIIFFQPSEFLKWILPAFAAFSFGISPAGSSPSVRQISIVAGIGILFVLTVFLQGDTGTALILILTLAVLLYLATDKGWIPLVVVCTILAFGAVGYGLSSIIHARIDTWWNPWWDASNTSYQVVQSLIAIASGGIIGRGPGLGYPQLVPVSVSDFLFTALAEEYGLVGAIGCLAILSVFVMRGLRVAAHCADRGLGLLAGGISLVIGMQAVVIAGGGIRLVPLTGVTFPWMSYGGSSLLSCAIGLGLLLIISAQPQDQNSSLKRPLVWMGGIFIGCILALGLILAWWGVYRSPVLRARTDNIRRILHDQTVARGDLYDRQGRPLAVTLHTGDVFSRDYPNTEAAPVTGYSTQGYGQGGLEAALDPWLRGDTSYNEFETWWSETVLGVPLRGLGARLTIDGTVEQLAGQLLGNRQGAVIVMRAHSGEVLALASHPTYDPARVDKDWGNLVENPSAPLLNRATQGLYSPGSAMLPFFAAQAVSKGWTPYTTDFCQLDTQSLIREYPDLVDLTYSQFRFWEPLAFELPTAFTPVFPLPVDSLSIGRELKGKGRLLISPMQLAMAAASLFSGGMEPAPQLVQEWETPASQWVSALPNGHPRATIQADAGEKIATLLKGATAAEWPNCETDSPWFVAIDYGSPDPLVVVVLLEDGKPGGKEIASRLIQAINN
jgi:cell division protein FtsW (lipid II flippase)